MKYLIIILSVISVSLLQANIDMDRYSEEQIRACYEEVFQKPANTSIINAIMKGNYNWSTTESEDDVNKFHDCLEKILE